jgi:hypothetical protein
VLIKILLVRSAKVFLQIFSRVPSSGAKDSSYYRILFHFGPIKALHKDSVDVRLLLIGSDDEDFP